MTHARPTPFARALLPLVVLAVSASCGEGTSDRSDATSAGGPAVCADGPRRPAVEIDRDLATLRPASRAPRLGDGAIYVVQSMSNTVGRFDLEEASYRPDFIDVGSGHNPYGLAVDPSVDRAWITNWLDDSITVADLDSGEKLDEIRHDSLDHPEGVAFGGGRVWVSNVAYRGGKSTFGEGSLAVVDRASRSVVGTVATEWKNPQHVVRVETTDGPVIVVVDSGVTTPSGEVDSPAGIEIWAPHAPIGPSGPRTVKLGIDRARNIGAPGRPLPTDGGRYLYFTSATAPVLFKFDLRESRWTRGVSNPIRLYESTEKSLSRGAVGRDGLLWIAAFNRDALFAFDTTCDKRLAGPIELGAAPEQLEGPVGLVPVRRDSRTDLYVPMTLANRLARARIRYRR